MWVKVNLPIDGLFGRFIALMLGGVLLFEVREDCVEVLVKRDPFQNVRSGCFGEAEIIFLVKVLLDTPGGYSALIWPGDVVACATSAWDAFHGDDGCDLVLKRWSKWFPGMSLQTKESLSLFKAISHAVTRYAVIVEHPISMWGLCKTGLSWQCWQADAAGQFTNGVGGLAWDCATGDICAEIIHFENQEYTSR